MRRLLILILLCSFTPLLAENQSDEVKNQMLRHDMLQWHQISGMAAWGLWLATNLKGEEAIRSLRRTQEPAANLVLLSNPEQNWPLYRLMMDRSEWKAKRGGGAHRALAGLTVGAYALTAGLALLSPSRARETDEFDSVSAHKLLALVHFAALASMPALGKKIEHKGPGAARRMQQVGWAGFGTLTVAVAVFYF
jgi:uncharacterized membrane protein